MADRAKPRDWLDDQLTYVPSGKFLKPMVLDFDEVVASLLWVRGMIYFADAYLNRKSYKWLGHILDVVTTLNPRFYQAYEFTGVVLTKEKHELPKTLRTLDRGIEAFPKDWKIRLYAAMGRLGLDSNYVAAAEYLQPLALEENVPNHIRTLSATFLSKGGGRRMGLAFLVNRYLRTANPIQRELFLDKILKLYDPRPGTAESDRRRVAQKILREALVEPMAEYMALQVLDEYLKGGEFTPTTAKLMKLLGE